MSSEDETVGTRIFSDCFYDQQREFESRSLPRDPCDLAAELPVEFLQFPFAIGTRGQCDRPVRMQMVHVMKGQKGMEGCIDGGSNTVFTERTKRIVGDHLIF